MNKSVLNYISIFFLFFFAWTAVCGHGCSNGGTCVTPDTCRCNTGWTGNSCQNGKIYFC